jgi:ATP-dependent RNA helicase DDX54/DBP10
MTRTKAAVLCVLLSAFLPQRQPHKHVHRFLQVVLSPITEHVKSLESSASELCGMRRSLTNAFNLYLRTRPAASPESTKRARALPQDGVHPLMVACLPPALQRDVRNETALAEFTAALKGFRPAATVLEAEIAGLRPASGAQPLEPGKASTNDVMQRKRAAHAAVIDKQRLKAAAEVAEGKTGGASSSGALGMGQPASSRATSNEPDSDGGSDGGGVTAAEKAGARQAAMKAAAFGDGVLNEGRFR